MKNFVHTYKGAVGSISDLCLSADGKFMVSTSLDRYVRIHDTNNCQLMYQCYVKSKATHVLMVEEAIAENQDQGNDNASLQMPVDNEYEEMFSNMQTIW